MKKAISVLMTVLLLATIPACADENASVPSDETPSISDGEPMERGEYGVLLPKGLLPDTGYAALQAPERYYESTTTTLIPSPGYGRVWPYIGGWVKDRHFGTTTELFGVCDNAGKIICDPVYNDVKLIERGGAKLYVFIENQVDPDSQRDKYINTLSPVDGSWTETYESVKWKEESGYELGTATDEYGFMRGYAWREPVGYDYITAQRSGKWGVLDWDGTVLLPFEYLEPVCFSEGLASILSDDDHTVSFIDISGSTVLGPYIAPPMQVPDSDYYSGDPPTVTNKLMFVEGRARYYDHGKYGMIDRDGNVVIAAEYDYVTSFSHGIALTVEKDGTAYAGENYGLVNDSGAVLLNPWRRTIENVNGVAVIRNPDYSFRDAIDYNGASTEYADDRPYALGNTFKQGDVEIIFPDSCNVNVIADGLLAVSERVGDEWVWRICDFAGTQLTPDRPGMFSLSGNDAHGNGHLIIAITSRNGAYLWPSPRMVYGFDGELILPGEYFTIIPMDGRWLVRGELVAGMIDATGEYVIKVPISAYGAD